MMGRMIRALHPQEFSFFEWNGVGVGVLEEGDRALSSDVLSPREKALLEKSVLPLRRAQWVRGRQVCKRVVCELLGPACVAAQAEVMPGDQGAPELRLPEGLGALDVSLSHAHTLSVAAGTARGRVGVDVEPLADVAPRLWHFFLSPEERARCEREPAQALRLWVLKEALYKALRPPQPVPLRSLVPEVGEGVLRLPAPYAREFTFTLQSLRNHLLAVVCS